MNRQLTRMVLTASFSVLFGSFIISAQDMKAVANVPFAFDVAGQDHGAGKYTVAETNSRGILQIRDAKGHGLFVSAIPETSNQKPDSLTFRCYDGQCSLSKIQLAGTGYKLAAPQLEEKASNRTGVAALISIPLGSR